MCLFDQKVRGKIKKQIILINDYLEREIEKGSIIGKNRVIRKKKFWNLYFFYEFLRCLLVEKVRERSNLAEQSKGKDNNGEERRKRRENWKFRHFFLFKGFFWLSRK